MRSVLNTLVASLLLSSTTTFAHPQPITDIQLLTREQAESIESRNADVSVDISNLWKRKGGGSSGGKGGSTSGGSSSGGKTGSSGKGSTSSNSGGATKTGSGVTPAFAGGKYGGGAKVPFTSGGRSAAGIVAVPLVVGAGAGLALYGGYHYWPYGAYAYPYYHPYGYYNRTARRNTTSTNTTRRDLEAEMVQVRQTTDLGANETKPVTCLCAMYAVCGCDDDGSTTFLDSIIGDGTYANLNKSLVDVLDINGTSTIVLNGTLPNGTTAAGGTEDAFDSAATAIVQASGYWVMIALVAATVYMV